MPNHCENELTIVGPEKELLIFKKRAVARSPNWQSEDTDKSGLKKLDKLSCNVFIPIPASALKSFNDSGYEWCVKNWGTKWGCYDVIVSKEKGSLHYYFQSAWSPPEPVVVAMSKQHPLLKFSLKYWESGVGYRGVLVVKKGKILKEECYEYRGSRGG